MVGSYRRYRTSRVFALAVKAASRVVLGLSAFQPDAEIIFQIVSTYETMIQQLHQLNWSMCLSVCPQMLGSNRIYAGTCRDLALPFGQQAIRVKVEDVEICFDDAHKADTALTGT
jgi:hypothetical protein